MRTCSIISGVNEILSGDPRSCQIVFNNLTGRPSPNYRRELEHFCHAKITGSIKIIDDDTGETIREAEID